MPRDLHLSFNLSYTDIKRAMGGMMPGDRLEVSVVARVVSGEVAVPEDEPPRRELEAQRPVNPQEILDREKPYDPFAIYPAKPGTEPKPRQSGTERDSDPAPVYRSAAVGQEGASASAEHASAKCTGPKCGGRGIIYPQCRETLCLECQQR